MAGVSVEWKQPMIAAHTTAATQLRTWIESEEGQHIWRITSPLPSVERICYALGNTRAPIYGLLISTQFFTIFSAYHQQVFTRLTDRYQVAIRTGVCFWRDGSTLHRCEHGDEFFELLRTLPPPRGFCSLRNIRT